MAQQKVKPAGAAERVISVFRIATVNPTVFLINPFTQQVFTEDPKEAEIDDWIKVQIKAGKLAKCPS